MATSKIKSSRSTLSRGKLSNIRTLSIWKPSKMSLNSLKNAMILSSPKKLSDTSLSHPSTFTSIISIRLKIRSRISSTISSIKKLVRKIYIYTVFRDRKLQIYMRWWDIANKHSSAVFIKMSIRSMRSRSTTKRAKRLS